MLRSCSVCHNPLMPHELRKAETRGMEATRKALGLQGVVFRFYTCSRCGTDDIFLDMRPLDGENDAAFQARRDGLEEAIRDTHLEHAAVVIVERHPDFSVWA